MFSQEVPCRSSASNASCFRFASALGIHDEYSDVLFSLLTLFTMCCLWFATTLPFACQRMRALLSSFVNCRQGVWTWNGSGFCFSESTSSMPARNPQCQGQAFLLPVFCGDNSVSRACLSLQQLLSHMATVCLSTNCPRANSIIKSSWPHELGKVEHEPGKGVIIISNTKLSWPHELGNVENEPGHGVILTPTIQLSRPS